VEKRERSSKGIEMKKRFLAALGLSILFILSMQWVSVSPANASPLSPSMHFPSIAPAAPGSTDTLQYSFYSGILTAQPSAHIIAPSSALLDTKIPHEVAINIVGTEQINLTAPITLSGLLKDLATGAGIPDKSITFSTYGIVLGQAHTDINGAYKIQINKDLPAGKYQVTASFKGAHLLTPASSVFSFEILPATFKVETVPAVAGITFQMDGQTFVSGQDGTASINVNQSGQYRLQVLLDQYKNASQQVQFGRWGIETYQTYRDVQVPSDTIIQVGLNVYHKINLKFIDLDGYTVDPSRITSISIRSIQGDVFTLKPGDTPWLPASRTARYQTGLEKTDLLYSVNSVTIDGSNVVNSAQQRFYAKADDTWSISLLLYSLHITARDALLASPTGKSVELIFPNGQASYYPLDKSGRLDVHALARGNYRVNLLGTNGLGTSTPVALSRNQVVNLNIITKMDLMAFGFVSAGLAMGLVIYGRPWLLGFLFRRKRYSSRQMGKDFGS
jgi:hypothetical protein